MLKVMSIILTTIIVLIVGGYFAYTKLPMFGELPTGKHKERIQSSPNYRDGEFKNTIHTPKFVNDESPFVMMMRRSPTGDILNPLKPIPSTDKGIKNLKDDSNVFIWLGHSTFYIQVDGKKILIDPVFSKNAAPIPGVIPAYEGTTPITAKDFEHLDYVLITHDHWDHLDHETLKELEPKIDNIITPLGVGSYLQSWGYPIDKIQEGDWYDAMRVDEGMEVHIVPARHFSGRTLKSNQTLWGAYVIKIGGKSLFISGDTGYGPHFEEVSNRYGGFDFATVEQGQYNERWPNIHMTPQKAFKAAQDLKAKHVLPSHVGKYTLAKHDWFEPFVEAKKLYADSGIKLHTPIIGQAIDLDDLESHDYNEWWIQ